MLRAIRTVMVFIDDPEASASWWAARFETEVQRDVDGPNLYAWLDLDGMELGFHPASPRNPHGGSTVPYWAVDDLAAERQRFLDAGCSHHRGPLDVAAGRRVCQLVDPFGMIFGLDGP
ncbi:VOC family protein [Phreatobacter stygius]|uniref:Glyoxalase n=1 Tax=Phreatobacter stygius TaxID=1940610 RepID=A0A4D7BD15_9HYPH|nr:VOC family protein [Phreatobacter stygius]QCI67888.1 glyoxalase [Phreatobacter stygius]